MTYSLVQGRGLAPFVEVATGAATALPSSDSRGELSISGAYLQQNFKYKNHLFLTGAVRVDGSSVFGEDERSQVYVKGSGSYVLSDAGYWDGSPISSWWNLFKLRLAYGESGNLTGIGPYERFNSYSSIAFLGKTSFFSSATLANTRVKPERQREIEFGTDLGFMDNRIGVQFNYYIKKVDDLLISRVIAPTTGFSSLLDNFGSLENKGFEVILNLGLVKRNDLRWELTGVFNRNRNKAVSIGQALTLLSTNAGAPIAILEGQPIGVFYGTFFAVDPGGNQLKNTSG
ncbi:MAG TPA: TonB-dependent receptor, partial [Chitinophagaceae bacterium]|nr:TonB-dependent receptor [Chitinophagaceae bacterium]